MKTNVEVATRPEAGKDAVVTNLTINWDGMSDDDVRALAQQALIVKVQAAWRKDVIPSGDHEINAVDFRPGVRAPRKPADVLTLLKAMSAEDRAALLAKLTG